MNVLEKFKSAISVCEIERLKAELNEQKEEHQSELVRIGQIHAKEVSKLRQDLEVAKQFGQNLVSELRQSTDEMERILKELEHLNAS